jgi:hypothetical protein
MHAREKVEKSRFTVFLQWFVAPGGRKVGSLKRRVRSHLARGEMKTCTPLWCEAHFEVKMYKAHHARTTFGSWDVQKVRAVVARSTFQCQHVLYSRVIIHVLWANVLYEAAAVLVHADIMADQRDIPAKLFPLIELQLCRCLHRCICSEKGDQISPEPACRFGGTIVAIYIFEFWSIVPGKGRVNFKFFGISTWYNGYNMVDMRTSVRTPLSRPDRFTELFLHVRCVPISQSERLFWSCVCFSMAGTSLSLYNCRPGTG